LRGCGNVGDVEVIAGNAIARRFAPQGVLPMLPVVRWRPTARRRGALHELRLRQLAASPRIMVTLTQKRISIE
jgi:hypothetical protein